MFTEKASSAVKETLTFICTTSEWCYGVFWGFDQMNSLLLTLKDAYYEQAMEALVDDMLLQVHAVGGGEIGEAALSQNHRWIYSDNAHHHQSHEFDDDSEFFSHFASGIKTIALIPIEPWGVVHFGSTKKIPETSEFSNLVKQWFKKIQLFTEETAEDRFKSLTMEQIFQQSTDELDQFLLLDESNIFDCQVLTSHHMNMETSANYLQQQQQPAAACNDSNFPLFRAGNYDSSEATTSNVTELIPLLLPDMSSSGNHNSPVIDLSGNFLPKNSTQSSIRTDLAHESNHGIGNKKKLEAEPAGKSSSSSSLFSRLGIDQLLEGNNCSFGSGFSANKRQKIGRCSWIYGQEKAQGGPSIDGNINGVWEIESKSSAKRESYTEEEQAGSIITGDAKGHTAKPGKRRAKSGTKPRPKDRQMIQDRLAELRQLVPNGEKMSIDRLLERTIRHVKYMQSLTKNAEILRRQSDHHKPSSSLSTPNNGVTWACEVGGRSSLCPLIVEDLTTQGQFLIEILYEARGSFLEIVSVIRSFGLTVLRGVMEDRGGAKIWARFIVEGGEGNRRVTRHEIFSSLIQLLQMGPRQNAAAHSNDDDNVNNGSSVITSSVGTSLFNDFQNSISFPVNNPLFAGIRQCS